MAAVACWLQRALFVLLASAAFAANAQVDPPGRVGRIAELQGQVWYYDLESGDWVAAVRNHPLTTGDRVATDGDGRAEIRIGSSTIRLAAGTEIDVQQLDDERVRVQLLSGQIALRLRSNEVAREFELVSAEGRFQPDRAGRYGLARIDATTSVSVWSGQLLFQAPDNAATVVAGQRADVSLAFGRTQYALVAAQRDAFADEVAAAEAAAERSVSTTRYVSPEMTGAEALDAYGRWENDADYGALWVPRAVVPGWAPYRFGHWAWIRPWGWTWVDDAPWGFAPFHYGRWVFWGNRWCWAPGTWVARPVFAPALVGWVGAPLLGISINIGGPSVGWFPLGPREIFVPPYRVTPRYVRNVNVTHVTNITNVTQIINSPNTVVQQTAYVNRGVASAVTVVPAQVVANRQPVAPARVELTDPHPGSSADRKTMLSAQAQVTAIAPVPAPRPQPAAVASGPGAASPPPPSRVATRAAPAVVAPPPPAQAAAVSPHPAAGVAPIPSPRVVAAPPVSPPAVPIAVPPAPAPAVAAPPKPVVAAVQQPAVPKPQPMARPQPVPTSPAPVPVPVAVAPPPQSVAPPAASATAPPAAKPPVAPPPRPAKDDPREKDSPKNDRR